MEYFICLSWFLGLYIVLAGLFFGVYPEGWKKFVLRCLAQETPPRWAVPLAWGMAVWVVVTWWKWREVPEFLPLVVALIHTLALVKVILWIAFYHGIRRLLTALLASERSALNLWVLSSSAIGGLLIAIGWFLAGSGKGTFS